VNAADDQDRDELLSAALQALEQGGEAALQDFLAKHESQEVAIRAGLERLRRMGILEPPPESPSEPRQFGEFRVLRRIGFGGMGVVYAAEQTSLQRTVALKVVRPEFLMVRTARERFQREIEAIARLQHPGIVPILAVGSEGARPWFAMEYVDGHTLDECLERLRGTDPAKLDGGALRSTGGGQVASGSGSPVFAGHYWEACVRLVAQVAAAMSYVHERGIVHRDLKPSNIVVDRQGRAMVLDFGLAHVRDLQRMTVDKAPIGSPAYVSPEQVRGEAVDERVDIYGLGVTLYELLTTHLPFTGDNLETLQAAILAGDARSVQSRNRAVPRDLAIVCAVAMDRDRARRYRSMADFAADLEAVGARRPIRARPPGFGLRAIRWAQRNPGWSVAVAGLLLVLLQFPLVLWRLQAVANEELARANRELGQASLRVQDAHGKALDAAALAQRQTIRLHVAEANRRLGDGDFLGALPPLVAALRHGQDDPAEHVMRLLMALRQCPQVTHHWTLPSRDDPRDPTLTYTGRVHSAVWSPDGKWIACATGATHIHLFDTTTGVDHGSEFDARDVEYVQWSRDGKQLLTGTNRNTLTLWTVATRTPVLRDVKHALLPSHPASLAEPVLDGNGRLIVFTADNGVEAFPPGGDSQRVLLPLAAPASAIAASNDARWLAVGLGNGSIALRDGNQWLPDVSVPGPVRVLSFSPNGQRLAAISGPRTLTLWDLSQSPRVAVLGEPILHDAYTYTIDWSADSKLLVTAAYGEHSAILVNGTSGRTEWVVRQAPGAMAAMLHPDGKRLLTAGFDNVARIHSVDSGLPDGPPLHHAGYVSVARWSPDGNSIFTGSYDGTARVWRLPELPVEPPDVANIRPGQNGRFLARQDPKEGRDSPIMLHDMSDGRLVGRSEPGYCAGLSDNGRLLLWDRKDKFEVLTFDDQQRPKAVSMFRSRFRRSSGNRPQSELSPDGSHAVITTDSRRWWVFDVRREAGKSIGVCEHPATCGPFAFSPDGRLFATAADRTDGEAGSSITVWELASARATTKFLTPQPTARLRFSPDGRLLACAGETPGLVGGAVRVHRCEDGQAVTPHMPHRGNVLHFDFSPDGRLLATGSRDSIARLWEVATGTLAAPEMAHPHHVVHLSFSADGKNLVTTTAANPALRVWKVATGEALTPPLRLGTGKWLSRFTEDGTALVTAGNVFLRWPLTEDGRGPEELVGDAEFLCGRRHDPLTGERPIDRAELQAMHRQRTATASGPR
jgi:WD40 repeat protein/tRNA A-37 threonylcarbamoyl transferase component Bud32